MHGLAEFKRGLPFQRVLGKIYPFYALSTFYYYNDLHTFFFQVALFFFRLTFMPITWLSQRNGRSPNVSILHVCDYITKRNLSTLYQHRKWNWRWLRLGEAAGMISKGKNRPTGMIGPRSQFLLDGRRQPLKYPILITLCRIVSCTDDTLHNATSIFNDELEGWGSQWLAVPEFTTDAEEKRRDWNPVLAVILLRLYALLQTETMVLSIWRNVHGSINWRTLRTHTTGLYHAVLHRNTHVRYAGHPANAERRIGLWDTTNSGIWDSDPT